MTDGQTERPTDGLLPAHLDSKNLVDVGGIRHLYVLG